MRNQLLWRGSLLPLGCEAAPNPATAFCQLKRANRITTASQPSGSKLPRHRESMSGFSPDHGSPDESPSAPPR
ncbi:hypothetical protein EI534_17890 [Pseudomonas frederiksbergensis]|nr:hypothetical protein [Pseudomonas frederiksbergensis]